MRKLALIINPSAGGGRAGQTLRGVQVALHRHGLEHHVERTQSLAHARELAREATAAGEVAVAFGGDGLVGAIADALKHTEGVLGVLPGGRGNDFARGLGIPPDPSAACQVLTDGVVRALDIGEAGSRTFVGIASCGCDSDANRIANRNRWIRGNLVYTYGALGALARWRPATFSVELDGAQTRTFTGYTVAAANSKAYGGGMMLAPGASLQDGVLDVVMIGQMHKLRLLAILPTVFKGWHVNRREVEVVRAREVRVSADRPFTVYADGDPIARLPVTIRTLARAVQVIVPA
ncbi:MAG: diacylglycerol/lipid kinase family protein [Solirubrobacteraceae bacterium]